MPIFPLNNYEKKMTFNDFYTSVNDRLNQKNLSETEFDAVDFSSLSDSANFSLNFNNERNLSSPFFEQIMLSWKQVNDRIKDNLNYPEWQYAEGETGFETRRDLSDTLFLVGNKVFKSKRSLIRLEQFDNLSKSAVDNRFKSHSFPEWHLLKRKNL
jgi:hypothetical protein